MDSHEPRNRLNQARPFKRSHHEPSVSQPHHLNITSVNRLKSKIRDLSRLLDHAEKLPADVRIEKERALAGYRQDLEQIENVKRKQKMITKYHKVRFFGPSCLGGDDIVLQVVHSDLVTIRTKKGNTTS